MYGKNWSQVLPARVNNSGWGDSHRNQAQSTEQAPGSGSLPVSFQCPLVAEPIKEPTGKGEMWFAGFQPSITQQEIKRMVRRLEQELNNPNKM